MALTERLENIAYNADLRTAQAGILYFRSTVAGTITKITIYRSGSGFGGVWIYNVRLNGTALFAGAGRPQLGLGESTVIKSGLSTAVAEGDVLQLDLEQNGQGVQLGHVVLVVEVELAAMDGSVPTGGTTGQLLAKASGTDFDTEWVDAPSGGAGSLIEGTLNIVTPPALGSWTELNGSVAVQRGDAIVIPGSNTANNRRGIYKALPDKNNFDIIAGVIPRFIDRTASAASVPFGFLFHVAGDDGHIGFFSDRALKLQFAASGTAAYSYSSSQSYGSLGTNSALSYNNGRPIFIRITRSGGGNNTFYVGYDGYTWLNMGTGSFLNNGGNPTHVGVFVEDAPTNQMQSLTLISWDD